MKINLEIDATPEEMRTFLGLPDMGPFYEDLLAKSREYMESGVPGYDPASLLKPILPETAQAFSTMQRAFWQSFLMPPARNDKSKPEPKDDKPENKTEK